MAGSSRRHDLPRARRLKEARDFDRLRIRGQRLACGCLILNWLAAGSPGASRLGVVTPRSVGNAVTRSRCRRLLREVFRRHQDKLNQQAEVVLVARPAMAGSRYAQVEKDYLEALRRARLTQANP